MKNGDKLETILPSETLLRDDFPVHFNYLYIVDGRVFRSDVQGNVLALKQDLKHLKYIDSIDVEVRRFDHSRFNS